MRRSERARSPVGYGPKDHICWVYSEPDDWREAASGFLGDGVAGGDQLLYVADRPRAGLVDDLAALYGRDELLASGQLQVVPVDEMYERRGGALDGDAQVAKVDALARAAVRHGYRSLRLAADVTSLVGSDDDLDRVAAYELSLDVSAAVSPWVVMCGYDARCLERHAVSTMCFVHPVHRDQAGGVDASFHAGEAGQWCLRGELDVAVRDAFRTTLAALPAGGPQHLDLSFVDHIEVAGVRALSALAVLRAPSGGVVLHRPPEVVRWTLDRLGAVPGLEVRP